MLPSLKEKAFAQIKQRVIVECSISARLRLFLQRQFLLLIGQPNSPYTEIYQKQNYIFLQEIKNCWSRELIDFTLSGDTIFFLWEKDNLRLGYLFGRISENEKSWKGGPETKRQHYNVIWMWICRGKYKLNFESS